MRRAWRVMWVLLAAASVLAMPAVDVSGNWAGELRGEDGGTGKVRITLLQNGEQISGTAGPVDRQDPPQIYDAKLEGNHLTFAADDADENAGATLTYSFDLIVDGNRMHGKAHGRSGGKAWTLDISVTREK